MNKKDRPLEWYFIEMLEAAYSLRIYVQDVSKEQFLQRRILREAVTRNFEVLGEAASQIPASIRNAYKSIPWRSMIGMRNVLIHDYFEISFETMWVTINSDLPDTILLIEEMYEKVIGLSNEDLIKRRSQIQTKIIKEL